MTDEGPPSTLNLQLELGNSAKVVIVSNQGRFRCRKNDWNCVQNMTSYFSQIYVSALLTSGNVTFIGMASDLVEWCGSGQRSNRQLVSFKHTVILVLNATKEYINSASSLVDPMLGLARYVIKI